MIDQTEPTPRHIERADILRTLVPGGSGGIGAEIGVYKGQFIRPVLDLISPAKLHLIDPWYLLGEEWDCGEEDRSTERALTAIRTAYEEEIASEKIVLHIGYSFDVLTTFPDGYFDWVYLDTVSDYQHIKQELALLKVKVKETGVIVGNNWCADPSHKDYGLSQAVIEFVETENYDLIYKNVFLTQWAIRGKGTGKVIAPSQEAIPAVNPHTTNGKMDIVDLADQLKEAVMIDLTISIEELLEQTKPTQHHLDRAEILQSLLGGGGVGAEIGVYKGQLIRPVLNLVSPQKLHLIDPWYLLGPEWDWGEESRSTMRALLAILKAYEEEFVTERTVLHIGYSTEVLATFPDHYFDWVYLDTTHGYDLTKNELALLKFKVKEDGIITGDDWRPDPAHKDHGQYRAINEFLEAENYELIYSNVFNTQWAIQRKGARKVFPVTVSPRRKASPVVPDSGDRTKSIFLHVGYPKTGSTSIQTFCFENQARLKSNYNLLYPLDSIYAHGPTHQPLSWCISRKYPATLEQDKHYSVEQIFGAIKEDYAAHDGDLLLSVEYLIYDDPALIRRQLDGYPVKVIVYVRRQDLYFESLFFDRVKWARYRIVTIDQPNIEREIRVAPLDYSKRLDAYAQAFGAENIILRPFEQRQFFNNDLIHDFFSTLGIRIGDDFVSIGRQNVSLSRDALEFKSLSNAYFRKRIHEDAHVFDYEWESFSTQIGSLLEEMPGDQYHLLTPSQREKLVHKYDQSNAYLARTFLNREDGKLFYGDLIDRKREATDYPGLPASTAVEIGLKLWERLLNYQIVEQPQEKQKRYTFGCNVTPDCDLSTADLLDAFNDLVNQPDFDYLLYPGRWRKKLDASSKEGLKIAVIATPHSEANLFLSLLQSHSEICCDYEVFHPDGVFVSSKTDIVPTVEERDANPIGTLEYLAARGLREHKAYAFRFYPPQNEEVLKYLLSNDEWIIIWMDRRNKLLQYASQQRSDIISRNRNQGKPLSTDDAESIKITFHPERFKQFVRYEKECVAPLVDFIEDNERDYIYVSHEELSTEGSGRVMSLLGFKYNVLLGALTTKHSLKQVSIDTYSNLPDVVKFIQEEMPKSARQWLTPPIDLSNASLLLLEKRSPETAFNPWNFIEQHGLENRVDYLPYYNEPQISSPEKLCDVWISKNTPHSDITVERLTETYSDSQKYGRAAVLDDGYKHVLYFTGFHPLKKEGNSVVTLEWLEHLIRAGYIVHLVYYAYDIKYVTPKMHTALQKMVPYYTEIPVTSRLVGRNLNGLNVHPDDWCGKEVIDTIMHLCDRFDFEMGVVHYPFFSKVLEAMPESTRKILHTHDRFANRNRRMLEQGFPESGWVSLTDEGEALACQRADVVVAIQEDEAQYFREISGGKEVVVVSPVFPRQYLPHRPFDGTLRVGYFGSANWINEQNLAAYMEALVDKGLAGKYELIVAGNLCSTLHQFADKAVLKKVNPRLMGRVENLADFMSECDVIVNPERGGTGMKIKSVETLSFGKPLLSTAAGMVGLKSSSRYHLAPDFDALAALTGELIDNPQELEALANLSQALYDAHFARQEDQLDRLFGHPESMGESAEYVRQDPKVSIIVPYYNVEDYLDECIRSVLNQDYQNWELILVDDASTDGSRAIALQYLDRDSRIRLVTHEQNQGLGPARNTGVLHAVGDFILFLDSDDLLKEKALTALVTAALQFNTLVVVGSSETINEYGEISPLDREQDHGEPHHFGLRDSHQACLQALGVSNECYIPLRAWGILIDRPLWLRFNIPFPPFEHEDIPVIPFIYKQSGDLAYIEDIVVSYRVRTQSLSRTAWDADKIERHRGIWQLVKERTDQFDLGEYRSWIALSHTYHLLWRIKNYGLEANAVEALLSLTQQLTDLFKQDQAVDLQHKINIIRDTVQILETINHVIDRDTYQQLVDCFGLELMSEYYKIELGVI